MERFDTIFGLCLYNMSTEETLKDIETLSVHTLCGNLRFFFLSFPIRSYLNGQRIPSSALNCMRSMSSCTIESRNIHCLWILHRMQRRCLVFVMKKKNLHKCIVWARPERLVHEIVHASLCANIIDWIYIQSKVQTSRNLWSSVSASVGPFAPRALNRKFICILLPHHRNQMDQKRTRVNMLI